MSHPDDYNLFEDHTRECPFPYFKSIRQEQPVYYMAELGAYYVSRYEDLRYVKKHPELFSNDIFELGAQNSSPRNIAERYRTENGWRRVSTLQRTDPPVHTQYRQLINHAFSVRRIRSMTGYIETVVNDLVDQFIDDGGCDFVWSYAIPLPCTVIADQLGVPRERIWQLKEWSDAMLAPGGGFVDEEQALTCGRQVVDAQAFFAEVIEARRTQPRDDIISDLVHARVTDGDGSQRPLDMYELQDLLDQLLTGGNETTTNAIGSAMMLLLERADAIPQLREDPKALRNFIEESLRYETPVLHLQRVATRDTRIGDVEIPAGARLALGYASANRDEAVFVDGEVFEPARKKAGAHLAFGSGPHHCPGAPLARQEMYSTFAILLNRLDNIRRANPVDALEHMPSGFLRGLKHMNLEFDIRNRDRYMPGASVY